MDVRNWRSSTDPFDLMFLQKAEELHLKRYRQIANLIQKKRPRPSSAVSTRPRL